MSDIKDRLLAACNGHPTAAIPWPHRLLHDAIDQIEAQQARNEALVAAATDVVWHISEFTDWKMGTEAVQRDIKALAALLQE